MPGEAKQPLLSADNKHTSRHIFKWVGLTSSNVCSYFFLFLQGRKSSQVCSCVGSFIHSINRYRYRVPCLPSIGLGVGINRWLLCISIFEEYTKQREARMAIYSWMLWGVVGVETEMVIGFRWPRREEDGSFASGPQRTWRKTWW